MIKPITDRIAELKARKRKLATRLTALESVAKKEQRKRDTRRKIVVGAAVITAMEKNAMLAESVRTVLAAAVTRDQDKQLLADLVPSNQSA